MKARTLTCFTSVILLVFLMFLGAPSASVIGSYVHDYGTNKFDPGGNDTLYTDYVLVSDKSSSRFSDSFDFSDLSYSTINQFDLTLTVSNTNASFLGVPLELWYMRPDGSLNYWSFKLDSVGNNPAEQKFTITDSFQPEFDNMVNAEKFTFWFAEETLFNDTFKLYSAKLDIHGEAIQTNPVPEPTTMVLFGIGLLSVAGVSRRKRN